MNDEPSQDFIEMRLRSAAQFAPVRVLEDHYERDEKGRRRLVGGSSVPIRIVMIEAAEELERLRAAVNALSERLAVKADMAKLNEPDGVLINMMRGTIPKVPSTSLHKLYTEDELIDAAKAVFRARAAFNQETKL
ncbi:hypothetical protein UFOVP399_16 [uncultured Caudovirales phage]|uniref:Uncharacterized protein n=1 Tax=uncultured Caudovirales phage TaxID=2100421 RepID=A0A6J5M732_9CAUD|nr:hypothetical protein UFOVP399_16 [uncultured Caudovirales phage]